jgi:hypothetical protein
MCIHDNELYVAFTDSIVRVYSIVGNLKYAMTTTAGRVNIGGIASSSDPREVR